MAEKWLGMMLTELSRWTGFVRNSSILTARSVSTPITKRRGKSHNT